MNIRSSIINCNVRDLVIVSKAFMMMVLSFFLLFEINLTLRIYIFVTIHILLSSLQKRGHDEKPL